MLFCNTVARRKPLLKQNTLTFFFFLIFCDVVSSDAPSRGEAGSIFMELSAIFTKVVWALYDAAS